MNMHIFTLFVMYSIKLICSFLWNFCSSKQLKKIFELCGTPDEINWPGVSRTPWYNKFIPARPMKRRVREIFGQLSECNYKCKWLHLIACRIFNRYNISHFTVLTVMLLIYWRKCLLGIQHRYSFCLADLNVYIKYLQLLMKYNVKKGKLPFFCYLIMRG